MAGQRIESGSQARCFAQYMTIHALEATGGLYYAQMPRYATADGKGTDVESQALKTPKGAPVNNPAREVWVQETALAGALNSSYMATQVGLFGIVVGIALLLSGLGFAILSIAGALRNPESVMHSLGSSGASTTAAEPPRLRPAPSPPRRVGRGCPSAAGSCARDRAGRGASLPRPARSHAVRPSAALSDGAGA